jgi:hypothetical protein
MWFLGSRRAHCNQRLPCVAQPQKAYPWTAALPAQQQGLWHAMAALITGTSSHVHGRQHQAAAAPSVAMY